MQQEIQPEPDWFLVYLLRPSLLNSCDCLAGIMHWEISRSIRQKISKNLFDAYDSKKELNSASIQPLSIQIPLLSR